MIDDDGFGVADAVLKAGNSGPGRMALTMTDGSALATTAHLLRRSASRRRFARPARLGPAGRLILRHGPAPCPLRPMQPSSC
jgi:hypothetical protein